MASLQSFKFCFGVFLFLLSALFSVKRILGGRNADRVSFTDTYSRRAEASSTTAGEGHRWSHGSWALPPSPTRGYAASLYEGAYGSINDDDHPFDRDDDDYGTAGTGVVRSGRDQGG
jgi:hypothetical protein